jgi:hypothetical protein
VELDETGIKVLKKIAISILLFKWEFRPPKYSKSNTPEITEKNPSLIRPKSISPGGSSEPTGSIISRPSP